MKLFFTVLTGVLFIAAAAFGQSYSIPPTGCERQVEFDAGHQGVTPGGLDWPVLGSVPINIISPTGLAFDGQFFRVPDWGGDIFTIDPATGLTVNFIPAPSSWPGGITFDGTYLWITDYIGGMVMCKVDATTGALLNSYTIPYSYYWAGCAWDGQYIYFGANTSPTSGLPDYIHKMDPNTGAVLENFAIPSTYISGLTYYDGHLWYSDSQEMMLYKITTTGTIVESSPATGAYPSGMTFANGSLYNVDNDLQLIYQYGIEPPDLSVALIPFNPPITVPANGGMIEFNIEAANIGTSAAGFDVWTNVTLPSGGTTGALILVQNLNFAAGVSADRDREQYVPANAPAGIYSYNAYVGSFPGTVWEEDEFEFEKLAVSDGGMNVSGWTCLGERFENETGELTVNIPVDHNLLSVYPNPFNQQATISYELQTAGHIELKIYDVTGREAATLVNGHTSLGNHSVVWDAGDAGSGVYFVKLTVDGRESMVKKVVLVK